jgi:hypothetical protein
VALRMLCKQWGLGFLPIITDVYPRTGSEMCFQCLPVTGIYYIVKKMHHDSGAKCNETKFSMQFY